MGRKTWREIRAAADPETIAAAERKTEAMLAALEVAELRKARGVTQAELAEKLSIRQGNVSRLERRADMHASTLRDVVEALGGELRITAHSRTGRTCASTDWRPTHPPRDDPAFPLASGPMTARTLR